MKKLATLSLLFGFWCAASLIAFADEPTWTADQRKKLETLIADHGHDVGLAPDTTVALGLAKKGEILTLRQLTVNTHPQLHAYIPLPDNGGYLLGYYDGLHNWTYRLDGDLKLIAAVSIVRNRQVEVMPMPEAEEKVRVQIAYWATLADRQ